MEQKRTRPLEGKVCLVTGASRGIGRGVALQLGEAGGKVYITGRTLDPNPAAIVPGSLTETAKEVEERGGTCIPVKCDHANDEEVAKLFDRIQQENDGRLDILVNNAFSGVKTLCENVGTPFWELKPSNWDDICNVGVRSNFVCAIHAAKLMVPRKQGLIVNVSSPGGKVYGFNALYGIGKVAIDRTAADCARDLKPHNVTFISLWPGATDTELIRFYGEAGKLDGLKDQIGVDYEGIKNTFASVEYTGKAVVHLALDPNIVEKSGTILETPNVGKEYGFKDVDGTDVDFVKYHNNQ